MREIRQKGESRLAAVPEVLDARCDQMVVEAGCGNGITTPAEPLESSNNVLGRLVFDVLDNGRAAHLCVGLDSGPERVGQ